MWMCTEEEVRCPKARVQPLLEAIVTCLMPLQGRGVEGRAVGAQERGPSRGEEAERKEEGREAPGKEEEGWSVWELPRLLGMTGVEGGLNEGGREREWERGCLACKCLPQGLPLLRFQDCPVSKN